MQVRPVTAQPRPRFHFWRRLLLAVLRWSFIVLGALAAVSVLFTHLYSRQRGDLRPVVVRDRRRRPVLR